MRPDPDRPRPFSPKTIAMIPDDESLLSAYLDGQLGPDERHAVEAALLADPRLAEELRGLAVLRDLLAGLPRESPADLTSRVMRRVRRRALLGRAGGLIAWGPVRAAGLVAVAAGVLAALVLPWLHLGRGPGGAGTPVLVGGPTVERPRPGISAERWPSFTRHADGDRKDRPAGPEGPRRSLPEPAGRPATARDDLVRVREYLDHPQLRHLFLVADPGDGSDERRVASVVEETTRFNYYKITISQGIVLDPRHPDEATVFALVVDPRELDNLRDRLRAALSDRVEEQPAEPGVLTRLADLGEVQACSPSPTADINIPRDGARLAFQAAIPGAVREAPEPTTERANAPTPEQERSSPAAEVPAGPRADEADRSRVVLVWVTRPRRG
jgi:hypothetical protein